MIFVHKVSAHKDSGNPWASPFRAVLLYQYLKARQGSTCAMIAVRPDETGTCQSGVPFQDERMLPVRTTDRAEAYRSELATNMMLAQRQVGVYPVGWYTNPFDGEVVLINEFLEVMAPKYVIPLGHTAAEGRSVGATLERAAALFPPIKVLSPLLMPEHRAVNIASFTKGLLSYRNQYGSDTTTT